MDINPFGSNTYLARVTKSAEGYLRCGAGDVDVGQNDAGVVAAELELFIRQD